MSLRLAIALSTGTFVFGLVAIDDGAVVRGEDRSFDGSGNNLAHADWGAAGTAFARQAPVGYVDGIRVPDIAGRPNPRSVGVALMRQQTPRPNARKLSGFVYAFGNLISHDIQHTQSGTTEFVGFRIPVGDDIFLPNQLVQLPRSIFDPATGTSVDNPRQQTNFTSSFLDASVIYGADAETASILRGGPANPGAKLRTSNDINGDGQNLLPRNAFGPSLTAPFVAGDSRVNDNTALASLHTLFMREHNRLVDELAAAHPGWSQEDLYQRARKIVGAQLQAITYNEFLPALLGPHAPARHGVYDPDVNASAFNEFPAVFLRVGHSMLGNEFLRIRNDGQPAEAGPVLLEVAFENPSLLATSGDLDLFLKGLSVEVQEETDLMLVEGMRVALLDAIDIQRARDHGIPDYNTLREASGLARVTSFSEITSDVGVQRAIEAVYGNVDAIDPLVGVLAEDLLPGASVGPITAAGYLTQFSRLRDGDRFWYENDPAFDDSEVAALHGTRLSDVIRRNTGVENLPNDVFFVVPEPGALAAFLAAIPALVRRLGGNRRHTAPLLRMAACAPRINEPDDVEPISRGVCPCPGLRSDRSTFRGSGFRSWSTAWWRKPAPVSAPGQNACCSYRPTSRGPIRAWENSPSGSMSASRRRPRCILFPRSASMCRTRRMRIGGCSGPCPRSGFTPTTGATAARPSASCRPTRCARPAAGRRTGTCRSCSTGCLWSSAGTGSSTSAMLCRTRSWDSPTTTRTTLSGWAARTSFAPPT
jgi:hypothetical protein